MLKKTKDGWQVVSEDGKPLSQADLSHREAEARLAEVEKMKRISAWIKSKGGP